MRYTRKRVVRANCRRQCSTISVDYSPGPLDISSSMTCPSTPVSWLFLVDSRGTNWSISLFGMSLSEGLSHCRNGYMKRRVKHFDIHVRVWEIFRDFFSIWQHVLNIIYILVGVKAISLIFRVKTKLLLLCSYMHWN